MLIRILEYNYSEDKSKLEDGKFIAAYKCENYDTFLSMLQNMKGRDILVRYENKDDEWYTYEGDYVLNFPGSDEITPSLDVFVVGY